MTTRVFIIPAAYRDAANDMAVALGWGGPIFVQPLSADGSEPPTHWGFPAVVNQAFTDLWDNPPPEAAGLVAAVHIDTRGVEGDEYGADYTDTAAHWYDVIGDLGLSSVQTDDGL